MKKSGKLACHVVNSNIAIGSLPTLQISVGMLALFERFIMKFGFLPSSQISGRMYTIPLFQISVRCEKCVAVRHYAVISKQLLNANDINRVRWVVLDLRQDGACTGFFENLSDNSLKGDLSNATTLNPPLFSLVDTFKHKKNKWRNVRKLVG